MLDLKQKFCAIFKQRIKSHYHSFISITLKLSFPNVYNLYAINIEALVTDNLVKDFGHIFILPKPYTMKW